MEGRQDWRALAEANTEQLRHAVAGLAAKLDAHSYPDFWQSVKQVSGLFKELKPTLPDQREQLWSEYDSLCQRAKEDQARARQNKDNTSRQKRELVEAKMNEAYHQALGARSGSDLRVATDLLTQALSWMKAGWRQVSLGDDMFHLNDGRITKADHDACWERWKEVKDTIKWRRKEICDFNYGQLHREACEADGLAENFPKEAKEKARKVQSDMKGRTMERSQFEEVKRVLDEAYERATAVQQRRRDAWASKMRDAKSRKLGRIEHLRDIIAGIERDIDRCRDMQREARSGEHEQRIQGWIEEKYDKVKDIEGTIRELEEAIRDIDAKLGE